MLPNKLQTRGYLARNVRANANFSGIVAKEFRPSARESVNFATVLRLLSQDFASEILHDRRVVAASRLPIIFRIGCFAKIFFSSGMSECLRVL